MTDVARAASLRADPLRERVQRHVGRGARSPIGLWFRDIDRVLLLIAMLLVALASPNRQTPLRFLRGEGGEVTLRHASGATLSV